MTDIRNPESESGSSSNENEKIDEGRAYRDSAKKHNIPSKKLRQKFFEGERVWVAVPGHQGTVLMSVVDSNQNPITGKWTYELKDSRDATYRKNNDKWVPEEDLEAGKGAHA